MRQVLADDEQIFNALAQLMAINFIGPPQALQILASCTINLQY